jgi:hypothetical protein
VVGVEQVGGETDAVIAGRRPCGHGGVVGESERETKEGDVRWGQDVSEREGAWARLGWAAGPRALLGRAGECGCGRERADGPRVARPSRREKEGKRPDLRILFSFSKM